MNALLDPLLSRKETAAAAKISERTLDRQTDLPRVQLTARRIMYRQSDVLAWIARKTAPRISSNDNAPKDAT